MSPKYPLTQTYTHTSRTHTSQIHWTRLGSPTLPPLVFIHGTPWSNVVWHDLATALSGRYCIYLYDHPGFGASSPLRREGGEAGDEKAELDASLVLRAEASAALFARWDLASPPHVVAHDNGGLVSLRLLLEHGVRFASLCLVDVVAMGASGLPFFKLVAENQGVFNAIPANLVEGFVRAYVKSAAFKPLLPEVEDLLCAPWLAGGMHGPEKFIREMVQAHHRDIGHLGDKYSEVGGLVPTKVIWGRDDKWLPFDLAEKLKTALNAEQVVVIEEAGHLVHYDQPGSLAFEVGLWLKESGRSSGGA